MGPPINWIDSAHIIALGRDDILSAAIFLRSIIVRQARWQVKALVAAANEIRDYA
jgi:hypothetical protein